MPTTHPRPDINLSREQIEMAEWLVGATDYPYDLCTSLIPPPALQVAVFLCHLKKEEHELRRELTDEEADAMWDCLVGEGGWANTSSAPGGITEDRNVRLICWEHRHVQLISTISLRLSSCAPVCTAPVGDTICGSPIWAVDHDGGSRIYVGHPPHHNWASWADRP